MFFALNLIAPIILMIIFGMLSKHILKFNTSHSSAMIYFLLKIAIPSMIILGISNQPMSILAQSSTFFFCMLAVTGIILCLALLYAKFIKGLKSTEVAFFAATTCLSNALMLAFPILNMIIGEAHSATYGILSVIVLIIGLKVLSILADITDEDGHPCFIKRITSAIKDLFLQPFFIAFIIGVTFSYLGNFGIDIPAPIHKALEYFEISAAPIAFFAVGVDLNLCILRKHFRALIEVSIFKLVLMPITAWYIAQYFHLPANTTIALVVCSSIATAKCQYALAKEKNIYTEESAAIVAGTTILTMISLMVVLTKLHDIYPSAFLSSTSLI